MDTTEQVLPALVEEGRTPHGALDLPRPDISHQAPVDPSLRWLTLADYVLSCLIVTPLIVSYWRATWKILDALLASRDPFLSAGLCAGAGWVLCAGCYLMQNLCAQKASDEPSDRRPLLSARWLVADHLYIYTFGVAIIAQWRGVWTLWDHVTGRDVRSGLTSLIAGWVCLVLLRCLLNSVAAPLSISMDVSSSLYECSTRFRTTLRFKIKINSCANATHRTVENFFLDVLFTTAVVHGLVASLWRGLWLLEELLLFAALPRLTGVVVSAGVGYCLVALCLLLQYSAQSTSEAMGMRFPFVLRAGLQDTLVSIGLVGVINVWRSLWVFHDIWQTGSPSLCVLVTNHALCIVGLTFLLTGSTVHFRGCMRDGEAAIFPVFYLRYLLRRRYFKEDVDGLLNKAGPTGKEYPSCSCNHYCLLLNVLRERNTDRTALVLL